MIAYYYHKIPYITSLCRVTVMLLALQAEGRQFESPLRQVKVDFMQADMQME